MKLIQKMVAIMFAFMMVLGMGTNVKAETTEGHQKDTTGTIIVSNPSEGHTYKLYKILNLESYSYDTENPDEGNYSYTFAGNAWDEFVRSNAGAGKFFTISGNYVTFNEGDAAALAKAALQFAQEKNLQSEANSSTDTSENLVFSKLGLGYYLVDSSVGALCNLTTTNPMSSIEEKNEVPTVTKKVYDGKKFSDHNNASIGDKVNFETTIDVKKGAQNYVLTDQMSNGLKLIDTLSPGYVNSPLHVEARSFDANISTPLTEGTEYTLVHDDHSFTVTFSNEYLKTHENEEYQIVITYAATLTADALIGKDTGNTNTATLSYGDSHSSTSTTHTYTFGIPVFKYTKKGLNETPLAGASFALYYDEDCTNLVNLIKSSSGENYRLFISSDEDANKVLAVTTNDTGSFNITGLKAGAYYLKEIEAPKGYNKLAAPIKVEIDNNGNVKVNGADADKVKVENKTGTLLPSTGGMGTTMIYMAGAILVIASGIVLVSKKRSKAK